MVEQLYAFVIDSTQMVYLGIKDKHIQMFYQTDDFVVIVLNKRIKIYSKYSWTVAFDLHFNEDIAQIFAKNDYLYVTSLNCSLFEILLGYD